MAKIALCHSNLLFGGVERTMVLLAEHLEKEQHQIEIIYDYGPKDNPIFDKYPIHNQPFVRGNNSLYKSIKLYQFWVKQKYDFVIFSGTLNYPSLFLCKASGATIINVLHEFHPSNMHTLHNINRYKNPELTSLIATSVVLTDASYQFAIKTFPHHHFVKINNALEFPIISNPPYIALPKYLKNKKVMLSVGRLCPIKNQLQLATVFSRLAVQFPDWHLLFIGNSQADGMDYYNKLKSFVISNHTAMTLLERVGNLEDFYQLCTCMTLPSLQEGFGLVIIEAMAYGKPVIAYDMVGPNEIIEHGKNGYLVQPIGDEVALEKTLREAMHNIPLLNSMGKKALEVKNRLKKDTILSLYSQLLVQPTNANAPQHHNILFYWNKFLRHHVRIKRRIRLGISVCILSLIIISVMVFLI
ncbi:MAG: glycosyltransferase [Methylacidiphilales bacterium]|nr:glycosyltransferase [Candidatus Methylacidiphilales bacterium]